MSKPLSNVSEVGKRKENMSQTMPVGLKSHRSPSEGVPPRLSTQQQELAEDD